MCCASAAASLEKKNIQPLGPVQDETLKHLTSANNSLWLPLTAFPLDLHSKSLLFNAL